MIFRLFNHPDSTRLCYHTASKSVTYIGIVVGQNSSRSIVLNPVCVKTRVRKFQRVTFSSLSSLLFIVFIYFWLTTYCYTLLLFVSVDYSIVYLKLLNSSSIFYDFILHYYFYYILLLPFRLVVMDVKMYNKRNDIVCWLFADMMDVVVWPWRWRVEITVDANSAQSWERASNKLMQGFIKVCCNQRHYCELARVWLE